MPVEKKLKKEDKVAPIKGRGKVKLEIYGEEMVEKIVKLSGNSGRVYSTAGLGRVPRKNCQSGLRNLIHG